MLPRVERQECVGEDSLKSQQPFAVELLEQQKPRYEVVDRAAL